MKNSAVNVYTKKMTYIRWEKGEKAFNHPDNILERFQGSDDEELNTLTSMDDYPRWALTKDPALMTAMRITRIMHARFNKSVETINSVFTGAGLTNFRLGKPHTLTNIASSSVEEEQEGAINLFAPLFYFYSADGESVDLIEHTNLPVRVDADPSTYKHLSHQYGISVLDKFYTEYKADMEHAKKRNKWKMAHKTLKRVKVVPFIRWLTANSNLKSLGLKDDQIRDMAEQVMESFLPLKVSFATSVMEVASVYDDGPGSCMSARSSESGNGRGWIDKENLPPMGDLAGGPFHPCAFYVYAPFTKVAYVRQNGTITARCVLWRMDEAKDTWIYTRIYSSTAAAKKVFTETLDEMGVQIVDRGDIPQKFEMAGSEFDIPVVGGYSPMPYLDYISHGFTVKKHKDNDELVTVVVHPYTTSAGRSQGNLPTQGTSGCMNSASLIRPRCSNCGDLTREIITAVNSTMFCGITCMEQAGYVKAIRSDGDVDIVEKYTTTPVTGTNFRFTTHDAAKRSGAVVEIETLGSIPYIRNMHPSLIRDNYGVEFSVGRRRSGATRFTPISVSVQTKSAEDVIKITY